MAAANLLLPKGNVTRATGETSRRWRQPADAEADRA